MSRREISAVFQTRTARAVCIWKDDASPVSIWLPVVHVTIAPETAQRGNLIRLSAPEKLLKEKGLL